MRIGALALQGDFAEHLDLLHVIAAGTGEPSNSEPLEATEVRLPGQLAEVDGLIIPGGESTTLGKLMIDYGLLQPLRQRIASGMPVFGTCAGAIVLARDIGGLEQPLIGLMDVVIRRNAFGRQLQSFEADISAPAFGEPPVRGVFIRAPSIESVGPGVEVLARLPEGRIVAAREQNMLIATFHPELVGECRLHRFFLQMVRASTMIASR